MRGFLGAPHATRPRQALDRARAVGGAQLLSLAAPQRDRRRESRRAPSASPKLEQVPARAISTARRSTSSSRWPRRARWEGSFADVRNLAILELFYSTGMRLSELQGINRGDLDLVSQQVKVRGQGTEGAHRSRRRSRAARAPQLRGRSATSCCAASGPTRDRTAFFLEPRRQAHLGARDSEGRHGVSRRDRRGRRPVACTRCATRSPRICSTPAPTCAPCRSCSATRRSRRRRSTRTRASSG